jgi:hypothetical protein
MRASHPRARGVHAAPGLGYAGPLATALAGFTALAGCADDGGPRLDAVEPPAARRTATVTIAGRRLCGATGDCARAAGAVDLGLDPPMMRAIVVSYSDTAARVVIPPGAPLGPSAWVVTVNERASNALAFEVLP